MINRNNYEEFFLMYVDGELSAAQKETVEAFVKQNPDLKEELNMLRQAVLLPEEDIFFDKTSLFKHTGNEITTTNCEEKFLLYVDDELDAKDKAAVETFVLQHPQLQEDFTLLKQTKLPAETIEFANKEVLYRKEEKERRVVYMRWYRMAAAAVIIGLGVVLYTVIPSSNTNADGLASNTTTTIPAVKPAKEKNDEQPIKTSILNDVQIAKIAPVTNTVDRVKNTVVAVKKVSSDAPVKTAVQKSSAIVEAPKQDFIAALNNLSQPEKTVPGSVTKINVPRTTNGNPIKEIVDEPFVVAKVDNADVAKSNNNNIQQVAYKELDTNDEKKSLLLGSVEINKDKLRGLFRKASRLFGNKQKSDEDKLAIASFAVNK